MSNFLILGGISITQITQQAIFEASYFPYTSVVWLEKKYTWSL